MIRRFILVVLTLAALTVWLLSAESRHAGYLIWISPTSDQSQAGFHDGHFWLETRHTLDTRVPESIGPERRFPRVAEMALGEFHYSKAVYNYFNTSMTGVHLQVPLRPFILLFVAYPAFVYTRGIKRRWPRWRESRVCVRIAKLTANMGKRGKTITMCVVLNAFFVALSIVTVVVVEPLGEFPGILLAILVFVPLGAIVGGLAGLVCAIICVPLLREKDLAVATRHLLTVVSPIAVVLAIVLSRTPLPFVHGFLVFVVVCVVLNRALPNVHAHDCCRECGYNLTGNVSGTCPECGTEVEQP